MEQQVFSSITKILPKILIAEDDQDLVELLRAIFLNKNYHVDVALNSENALDLFQRQRYQVVLLDINMPGDTGIQLAERIRNMDKNTQIVIMTAYSDVDYAIQAIQFQVFEYVIKPFKVEDLV
ncbi:MAG: response regulator, partial [Calditrichaeota bacterium]